MMIISGPGFRGGFCNIGWPKMRNTGLGSEKVKKTRQNWKKSRPSAICSEYSTEILRLGKH